MIEPKPLKMGGKIAIVAPSGPLEIETVFRGEELLKLLLLHHLQTSS